MKPQFVFAASRYVGVAILFAACGAWQARFFPYGGEALSVRTLQIPFALLCAVLFLRTVKAILAVPLIVVVWVLAWKTAVWLGMELGSEDHLTPMCVGGFVGGLGLALCAAICHRRSLSLFSLLGAGFTGCVAALPFGLWLRSYYLNLHGAADPLQPLRLQYAFAIWQAAVGTYLYAVCTQAKKKAQQEKSQEGHPL